jgi:hypothetical protein
MNPLLRLLGAAASNGLLSGQIIFSTAFVGACELPNWIQAPRQVNGCRSRSPALALFFPSGMQTAAANNQVALAPCWRLHQAFRSIVARSSGLVAAVLTSVPIHAHAA